MADPSLRSELEDRVIRRFARPYARAIIDVNEPPSAVFTRSSSGAFGSAAATPLRTTASTDCGASGRSVHVDLG